MEVEVWGWAAEWKEEDGVEAGWVDEEEEVQEEEGEAMRRKSSTHLGGMGSDGGVAAEVQGG